MTDGPIRHPGTAHGPSVYREMEALRGAGLTPDGKRADLVVLEADPLSDVANYQRIRFVMRNGVLHQRADLVFSP